MKVAIIGAPDSVDKIYGILSQNNDDVEFIIRSEEKVNDMVELVSEIEDEVDGIYLTGIGVYSGLNNSSHDISKPVVYTKRGITGIIKSFWEFKENFPEKKYLENLKLGIDVVEEKDFLEAINEFDIKLKSYVLQKYDFFKSENEYLKIYLEKIKSKEINCVFTAFGHIYSVLKEMNFPVYRVQATSSEINDEFKNLKNRIRIKKAEKSKICVEIIKIEKTENINLYRNLLSDKFYFEKSLIEYSNEVEGNIQILGDDEYLIISNKELLNNIENLKTIISLIKDRSYKGFFVGVGIGEGDTIFQAEKNARKALKLSINEKENNIYFSNNSEIKGPLLNNREIKYNNISDKKIMEISKVTGVSSLYIEKIKSIMKKHEKNLFTSKEISEFLNITERSVNRIIKKIIENGYAEEGLFENPTGAGRPRRKIKFKF